MIRGQDMIGKSIYLTSEKRLEIALKSYYPTKPDLALMIGAPVDEINRYLDAQTIEDVPMDTLEAIADKLKLPVRFFLEPFLEEKGGENVR
jgi:hypothetical protein